MKKFFNQKISPVIAFVVVIVFGYFAISLMDQVFEEYASNELLAKNTQPTANLDQILLFDIIVATITTDRRCLINPTQV